MIYFKFGPITNNAAMKFLFTLGTLCMNFYLVYI